MSDSQFGNENGSVSTLASESLNQPQPMKTTTPTIETFKASFQKILANNPASGEKPDVAALFPPAAEGDITTMYDVPEELDPKEKADVKAIVSLYQSALDYESDWTDVYDAIKKSIENKSAQERIDTMMDAEDELQSRLEAEDEEDGEATDLNAILDFVADFQEYFLSVIYTNELPPITDFNRIALILRINQDLVKRKMFKRFGRDAFIHIGRNRRVPRDIAVTFIREGAVNFY